MFSSLARTKEQVFAGGAKHQKQSDLGDHAVRGSLFFEGEHKQSIHHNY
jgi:hypothetical protein